MVLAMLELDGDTQALLADVERHMRAVAAELDRSR